MLRTQNPGWMWPRRESKYADRRGSRGQSKDVVAGLLKASLRARPQSCRTFSRRSRQTHRLARCGKRREFLLRWNPDARKPRFRGWYRRIETSPAIPRPIANGRYQGARERDHAHRRERDRWLGRKMQRSIG